MPSMNKVTLIGECEMYISGLSISDISKLTGRSKSTLRLLFKKEGILRNHREAMCLASKQGKFGSGNRGKIRPLSNKWRDKIKVAMLRYGEAHAKGTTKKQNGYIELTRGKDKGKREHILIMENFIGRKITNKEVVHHINSIRDDNRIENLQVMTRKKHSELHGKSNYTKRKRNIKGQFKGGKIWQV